MPGLLRGCAAIALAGLAGCLDIPPYRPCGDADRDCDGWPAVGVNPMASDCDDANVLVNPGVADDPGTTAIEDCFGDPVGAGLAPVTPAADGWRVGELALEFASASRMPSSLRLGNAQILAGNPDACLRDERMAGISLYPAFGVDHASLPTGVATALRGGPALATTRVTWAQDVPMAATEFGCDAATRVSGTIDFTVQPSGRVVRHDRVTVSAGVSTCVGCADTDGNPPIFTSYLTFSPELERYQVEPAVTSTVFPVAGMAVDLQPPSASVVGCVTGITAASSSVGLAWRFPTAIAGMRARTTADTRVNHAMVVDWVNGGAVAAGTYELITALAVESDGVVDCSVALRTAMAEFARPPTLTPTSFVAERGSYRYTGEEGVGIRITADQGVEGGAVIEVPNASERGVTVWRGSGAAFTRLRRGQDYLLQLEADRTAVIYLPALTTGSEIVVSGPGGEPPP